MLNQIDLSRIDLNLLTLFEVVMEERHVGRAAQRVNLSPSAISHGLGRLRRLLHDPLFLRTPTGVIPTARAQELAEPIAEVLAAMRRILVVAEPFNPATSRRRLVIAAPDGVSAVLVQALRAELQTSAPNIAIGLRQLLPVAGENEPSRAWRSALEDLETRVADIAIVPTAEVPARFAVNPLYHEDFVLGMRGGHRLEAGMSLSDYADAQHLVVSASGDAHGFVDDLLAQRGLARHVMLTVPNFFFAAALLPDSDLVCAFPRRFAKSYAARFGISTVEPPLPLGQATLNAISLRSAQTDEGLQWLLGLLAKVTGAAG